MTLATSSDVSASLDVAAAAAPVLCSASPSVRATLLRVLAERLELATDELVAECAAETLLPTNALRAEVERTSRQLRFMADEVTRGRYLDAVLAVADDLATRPPLGRVRMPLGPVLVFEASNFPFAFGVLGNDVSSALAAGAPVLVKVHEGHPRTSARIAQLALEVIERAELPRGTLQLLDSRAAATAALSDHRVKACGFTGSLRGGQALQAIAAGRSEPIPFFGELGSANPVVVTRAAMSARESEIVESFFASVTLRSGQLCTKPGIIFVPADCNAVALLEMCLADGQPTPLLADEVASAFDNRVEVVRSTSGVRTIEVERSSSAGRHVRPTIHAVDARIFASVSSDELREENFGPGAVVVLYEDAADLRAALSTLRGSLTASLHAEAGEASAHELVGVLSALAGRVIFNGWPTGVAVSPATQHGGPWPSSTNPASSSIGSAAIERWTRPIGFQNVPDELLPPPLQHSNPWQIERAEISP
jgi:NADP-dependent aldehyde dehydrogenase